MESLSRAVQLKMPWIRLSLTNSKQNLCLYDTPISTTQDEQTSWKDNGKTGLIQQLLNHMSTRMCNNDIKEVPSVYHRYQNCYQTTRSQF